MKKSNKGVTLIELMVVIALLGFGILIAVNMIFFSGKSHKNTLNEFNFQSEMRLSSQTINKDIRNSTAVFALPQTTFEQKKAMWDYIGLKDSKTLIKYTWNEAKNKHDEEILYESKGDISLNLMFRKKNLNSNLIEFTLQGYRDGESEPKMTITSEIQALNAIVVEDGGTPSYPSVALAYRSDDTPGPTMKAGRKVVAAVALVLDKSGSMDDPIDSQEYRKASDGGVEKKVVKKGKRTVEKTKRVKVKKTKKRIVEKKVHEDDWPYYESQGYKYKRREKKGIWPFRRYYVYYIDVEEEYTYDEWEEQPYYVEEEYIDIVWEKVNGAKWDDEYNKRIKILRDKASKLVDTFDKNVYVSIIPYSNDANGEHKLYNAEKSKSALKTSISSLKADGGTNTGDGMRRGFYALEGFCKEPNKVDSTLPADTKVIPYLIVLTDGNPTFYSYYSYKGYDYYQINSGDMKYRGGPGGYMTEDTKEYIKVIAEKLIKGRGLNIKTYAIGYSANPADISEVKKIAEYTGGQYYEANSDVKLDEIFDEIGTTIVKEMWHIYGPYANDGE
ncbi:MAG: VWA domain-containing protein [Peptoanaerobacter stomatis]